MSSRRPDNLWITVGWNEKLNANVFGIRGMGRLYDHVWDELNEVKSARTAWTDFPWSYVYFFDEDAEKKFRADWAEGMRASRESPPKDWHRPIDPEGYTWCPRCHTFHKKMPEGYDLMEDITNQLTAEIAAEIDKEIIAEMLQLANRK